MMLAEKKQILRHQIDLLKKKHSFRERDRKSDLILYRIETSDIFRQANRVLLYHALPDEVQTQSLLERWHEKKELFLPVVNGSELDIVPYVPAKLKPGHFGILEPTGIAIEPPETIDLIVIPGVAFDRQRNRLGRGRGFYDRLLTRTEAFRIGICFGFQLLDSVPTSPYDIRMDRIITENDFIDNDQTTQ